ncbi:MAG: SRPBCC family protein [Pseudonocardiaceae bacterium]
MTMPNVPLRMEFSVEVPGTPEQVWDAIATTNGISSWFLPTDVEEREGGAIVLHMGDTDSPGTITGWDPPRRLEYSEPEWAALTGHDVDSATPMVTEFLVEAQSGGTCVVHVVSSAFGTGADWEQEFFDDAKKHWLPFFDNLRLYLAHFPGQRVTSMEVAADVPGASCQVFSAMREALGAGAVGKLVDTRGVTGQVERLGQGELLLRLTDPVPGFLGFLTHDKGNGSTMTAIQGYLFSDDAAGYVEREAPAWKAWLQKLTPAQ